MLDYAPGVTMRQDVYRVAFDEATGELNEILGMFEQLRLRKDHLEKAIEVLKPLVTLEAATLASGQAVESSEKMVEQIPEPILQAADPLPVPVQEMEATTDPFQRRINNVLRQGFGASAGDGREYSRLFGGLSRGH